VLNASWWNILWMLVPLAAAIAVSVLWALGVIT
jgi:hypothetical protein